MNNREKVINGLREMSCRATWKDIDEVRHKFQPIINDAIALLKEQEADYEKGYNDAMLDKQKFMYEGIDGKWYKKDW